MGEFERIARLARRFGLPPAPAVGIGHDCALVPPAGTWTAWSVDASVEGVHFARNLIALDQAADRAVEAALSDLAAAGATIEWGLRGGCGVLSAMAFPPSLDEAGFDALVDGTARAVERHGGRVLGGNLSTAPVVSLTTTVIGRLDGHGLSRAGARPGETVYVTGVVGAAALGLHALRRAADDPRFEPFIMRWRAPRARLDVGCFISPHATAAIDLSDGLAQDLGHLCRASGCAVILDVARLPMLAGQRDAAAALGLDAVHLALTGGEDYELCFTAGNLPASPTFLGSWTAVGEVVAGCGVLVRDAKGTRAFAPAGWDHFRTGA